MSVYKSLQELLNDAIAKGLIKVGTMNLQFGPSNIISPTTSITIIKFSEWKQFLSNVVENSDNPVEKQQASMFFDLAIRIEQIEYQQLKNSRPPIDELDISVLHSNLQSCNTIDDIIDLIDKKSLRGYDVKTTQLPKTKTMSLVKLRWKKPVIVNNKIRYYSYDLDWYIEKQFDQGPKGGKSTYYSIFSNENTEIVRFNTLKDAKQNLPHIFNLS